MKKPEKKDEGLYNYKGKKESNTGNLIALSYNQAIDEYEKYHKWYVNELLKIAEKVIERGFERLAKGLYK